jgi:hypothetical protein
MKETGLTSNQRGRNKEELDEESKAGLARINQNDAEIDLGIDAISQSLDAIGNLANNMKEEVL